MYLRSCAIPSPRRGDEFIVLAEISDRMESERLASEIHQEIMRPIRVDGDRLEVRASLGVACLPEDGRDADTLMQSADLALYHAKVGGRAQTRFFDPSMTRDPALKLWCAGSILKRANCDLMNLFLWQKKRASSLRLAIGLPSKLLGPQRNGPKMCRLRSTSLPYRSERQVRLWESSTLCAKQSWTHPALSWK